MNPESGRRRRRTAANPVVLAAIAVTALWSITAVLGQTASASAASASNVSTVAVSTVAVGSSVATELDRTLEPAETAPPTTPGESLPALVPPTITSPAAGELLGGSLTASGTGTPGSTIQILVANRTEPLCITTVDDAGSWSCSSSAPESGPNLTIRAVQQTAGEADQDTSVTVNVLRAPTAESGSGGLISGGTLRGTGYPSATVTATVAGVSCSGVADSSGAWFCLLPRGLTSGQYSLTATQSTAWGTSAASDPVTLTIDVDVPDAPTITTPATGTTLPLSGVVFSGTGEEGANVTVFAGAYSMCQATVSDGTWSCTGVTVEPGSYGVSALQQDAAGNISPESPRTAFEFSSTVASPTPSVSPAPSAQAVPGGPTKPGSGGANPPQPGAIPPQSGQTPGTPGQELGPQAGGPNAVPTPGSWAAATPFGSGLQSVFGQANAVDWRLALGIGLGIAVLLAIPARLLAGTIGRLRREKQAGSAARTRSLTGRNRSANDYDRAPSFSAATAISGVIGILVSAALTILSSPVESQPAYLRLYLAVTVAIVLVNLAAVTLPRLLAKYVFGLETGARFAPWFFAVTAAAALLSRSLDLHPAFVFGLAFALTFPKPLDKQARGIVRSLQITCLLVVGSIGWLLTTLLNGQSGFGGLLAGELATTLALGGLGAAGVLLLPIGTLPGRTIVQWSPVTWLVQASIGYVLLGAVLAPSLNGLGHGAGLLTLSLAAFVFAAIAVSVWMWARFIRGPVAQHGPYEPTTVARDDHGEHDLVSTGAIGGLAAATGSRAEPIVVPITIVRSGHNAGASGKHGAVE